MSDNSSVDTDTPVDTENDERISEEEANMLINGMFKNLFGRRDDKRTEIRQKIRLDYENSIDKYIELKATVTSALGSDPHNVYEMNKSLARYQQMGIIMRDQENYNTDTLVECFNMDYEDFRKFYEYVYEKPLPQFPALD